MSSVARGTPSVKSEDTGLEGVKVILASASPRRAQLLSQLGVQFTQKAAPIDETQRPGEHPVDYVRRMALMKALAAPLVQDQGKSTVIIASDTTVVLGDMCLGKPKDKSHFVQMMTLLSGEQHEVLTAVSVRSSERHDTFLNTTRVWFRPVTAQEIDAYWVTGEPVDKAGGYAIQGLGAAFVARIDGSYSAVMGLPLQETAALLSDFGVPWGLNGS